MKRIIYLLIPALLLGVSCNKQLDTVPSDFLTPINYYQTADQLEITLTGVYDVLATKPLYQNQYITCYSNDEAILNKTYNSSAPVALFDYAPTDAYVNDFWTSLYDGVNRANVLLDVIKQNRGNLPLAQTDPVKGQALFLRAYYYFFLADNFGDVPMRLEPLQSVKDVNIAGTPLKEVYAQIISDMTMAEALVPEASVWGPNSCGRISKQTIEGILARVCLTMAGSPLHDASKYQDALKWSKKVIDLGQNALNPDFAQIFINEAQNVYDIKECLWEVEFYGNVTDAHREEGYVGVRNGLSSSFTNFPGPGQAFLHTTAKLFNIYPVSDQTTLASKDLRRDRTVAPYQWTGSGDTGTKTLWTKSQIYDRWPGKWRRDDETMLPRFKNGNSTNFPILRYSDVLLMYAEAENQVHGPTSEAYRAINQVRERGWGKLLPGATNVAEADLPAGLLKDDFQLQIRDERMRELAMECLRTHDLKRWGILISNMQDLSTDITAHAPSAFKYQAIPGNNIKTKHLLYPIPSSETALNNAITQNPGW